MANTLTNLIPDLYAALDVVSREAVGMIPAVTVDANVNRASVNQTVYVPIAPASSAGDISPAMSVPAAADQTISNTSITISKARAVPFSWNGNEQGSLNSAGGPGYLPIRAQQMAQAMRTLVNEVETDLCGLYNTMSRAAGTAGITPFASNTAGATAARKILIDNGAPQTDLQLVVDTGAGANIRTLYGVQTGRADVPLQDQGILTVSGGTAIRESGQVRNTAAGAMANATTSAAALTVGQTVLPLATAGTGVVSAGDVITLANDTNQYVVTSVSFAGSNPASGDSITIAAPGIRVAQGSATRAITVVATSVRNMAFSRSAIVLATRMPERPQEGDMALDVMQITDPRTGLSFEVSMYPGYRMVRYEVALAWGVKNIKPAHTALLLG